MIGWLEKHLPGPDEKLALQVAYSTVLRLPPWAPLEYPLQYPCSTGVLQSCLGRSMDCTVTEVGMLFEMIRVYGREM